MDIFGAVAIVALTAAIMGGLAYLVTRKSVRWLFNRQMIGAVLSAWLIWAALQNLAQTSQHDGPGVITVASGGDEEDRLVSEASFKRNNYVNGAFMLLCGIGLWVLLAQAARGKGDGKI